MIDRFTHYRQLDSMDCGPTCLKMVAKAYGKTYSLPFLREKCYIDRAGVSIKGISEAAELIGLRSLAVKIPILSKKGEPSLLKAPMPSVVHWNQNHFVVIYSICPKGLKPGTLLSATFYFLEENVAVHVSKKNH